MIDTMMRIRATSLVGKCEYCGKRLVIVDGNRIVPEVNGFYRRACKGCAEELTRDLVSPNPKA